MKLYWKIYSVLALTTLVALLLIVWIAFSVVPDNLEQQREHLLDDFESALASGDYTTRDEIAILADSMGVDIRPIRGTLQMIPPDQMNIGQGPPRDDLTWRGGRLLPSPVGDQQIFASVVIAPARFLLLIILTLGIFGSQAIALRFGLKSVFKRVSLLTRVTGDFGKGQLTARYPDHGSSDELDTLGISFNTMAEKIISLLGSHNELLSAVAHELRTPMARLSFALELARGNPEAVREKLGLMEKDLFELDKLVSELLEFNRIGGTEPGHEKVSLSDLSHVAADGEKIHSPSVEISIREQGRTPSVTGDHRLLLRAISNLVRNAVNYADSTVTISIRSSGKNVLLSVTDDGPGFPPGFADRAVSPFIKGEKSKGTGLGLSIVQRIAEKHNGTLTIGNSPSGGASAELSIPV